MYCKSAGLTPEQVREGYRREAERQLRAVLAVRAIAEADIHHPNTAAGMLLHAGTSTSSVETRYGTGETITAKQSCAPHNES